MTPRCKKWFEDAVRRGVDLKVAYFGAEVIDGWGQYWKFEIPSEHLEKMTLFALSFPEAALHRWSILAGPCPWVVDDSVAAELKQNPKFSACDVLAKQNIRVRTRDTNKDAPLERIPIKPSSKD